MVPAWLGTSVVWYLGPACATPAALHVAARSAHAIAVHRDRRSVRLIASLMCSG
jgi:hypothetical protein